MTLVHKAALTVALFAVANLGFAYAIKHNWIDPAFEGSEQRLAEKSMMQVAEALEREIFHIDILMFEYSSWDDTYQYAESGDPKYYDENLSLDVMAGAAFNWITVVNASGRVVSGPIYDIQTRQLITTPEILQGQWDLSHPLLSSGGTEEESISGVMVTRDGLMIVASRSILTG